MKRSKALTAAAAKVDRERLYAPLEAVRLAKDKWTRISWNESTRQHDVATCDSTAEPEWPDLPFRELLKLAFKNFVIDNLDHPVLKRLRGDVK